MSKVPDKLYIICDAANNRGMTVATEKPMFSDDLCYIRKGAISDLLNSEMKRHADRHSVEGISACHAMRELIEKFNNL